MAFAPALVRPEELTAVRIVPAPTHWSWFGALSLGSLWLSSFPGFHEWDSSLWLGFVMTGLVAAVPVASLVDKLRTAPHFREYGLTVPSTGRLGESIPVWFQLTGGPQGCLVGPLTWTLTCSEVTHVETDYSEYAGRIDKPTCETRHESHGSLSVDAELRFGEDGTWLLNVPLPAGELESFRSQQDVVGAVTWQLTVTMEAPGQPGLDVTATLQVDR